MAGIPSTNMWPHYSSMNTSAAKEKSDQSLGKDDFLKILVAQLKHQDPMQPMEDKEFIAQMAQFSSVEQIQSMSEQMQMLRQSLGISSDLIGKTVNWVERVGKTDQIVTKSGVVDSIWFKDGKQLVQVGENNIPLEEIQQVWIAEDETPADQEGQADE